MSPADRTREIAAIHVMAAQLGLDTHDKSEASAYRQMLLAVGGASSAALLTAPGRRRVLAHLRSISDPSGQARARPPGGWQAEKIRQLWQRLGAAGVLRDPSERSLREFVRSLTGADALPFLSAMQGRRVIEALKAWSARHGRDGA